MLSELKIKIAVIALVAILVVIVVVPLSMLVNVPAGYKAVVVRGFGVGHVFDEGWNMKNPLSSVDYVRYNTQRVEFIGASYGEDNVGNIVVNSKDNVAIFMDFQVVFHLEESYVGDIRIQNGDFEETIIVPICRSVPRDVCAKFDALEIRGDSRDLVASAIERNITAKFSLKHIVMEEFALQEISLPVEYESAINEKKVAEQKVITEEYNLDAQSFIAEREIIDALAQANVTIIDAEAKGLAVGIIMDQFNVTDESEAASIYLQWLYIRALTDENTNIEYIMGDNPFILDLTDSDAVTP